MQQIDTWNTGFPVHNKLLDEYAQKDDSHSMIGAGSRDKGELYTVTGFTQAQAKEMIALARSVDNLVERINLLHFVGKSFLNKEFCPLLTRPLRVDPQYTVRIISFVVIEKFPAPLPHLIREIAKITGHIDKQKFLLLHHKPPVKCESLEIALAIPLHRIHLIWGFRSRKHGADLYRKGNFGRF